jgi:hypothetical protein
MGRSSFCKAAGGGASIHFPRGAAEQVDFHRSRSYLLERFAVLLFAQEYLG